MPNSLIDVPGAVGINAYSSLWPDSRTQGSDHFQLALNVNTHLEIKHIVLLLHAPLGLGNDIGRLSV